MRRSRVSSEEQYRLIMECRQSGLSDHQWCLEHDINPGTFYNWVKRLRQKQCQDIPEAVGCRGISSMAQEVVKVDLQGTLSQQKAAVSFPEEISSTDPVMELSTDSFRLRIPNGTDPVLLSQMIRILKEYSC